MVRGFSWGREAYGSFAGDLFFQEKGRNPKIIAGTLAFMLAKDEGRFLKVKPSEIEPLREALHFLRTTNVHIRNFWTSRERFEGLWHNLQVPASSGRLRVRAGRGGRAQARAAVEHTLGEMLGEEEVALVIIDPREMPRGWTEIWAAEDIGECFPWTGGGAGPGEQAGDAEAAEEEVETQQAHATQTAAGAREVQETSYVTRGDPHLDAKLFPVHHPYGPGSLRADEGAGGLQRFAKSRLLSLDSGFRRSATWQPFNLDRLIKNDLYFRARGRL